MNNENHTTGKRNYQVPQIETVKLDNEISLALESFPPFGPGEFVSTAPEYFNNDPYKTDIA